MDEFFDAKVAHKSSHRVKMFRLVMQTYVLDKIGGWPACHIRRASHDEVAGPFC